MITTEHSAGNSSSFSLGFHHNTKLKIPQHNERSRTCLKPEIHRSTEAPGCPPCSTGQTKLVRTETVYRSPTALHSFRSLRLIVNEIVSYRIRRHFLFKVFITETIKVAQEIKQENSPWASEWRANQKGSLAIQDSAWRQHGCVGRLKRLASEHVDS